MSEDGLQQLSKIKDTSKDERPKKTKEESEGEPGTDRSHSTVISEKCRVPPILVVLRTYSSRSR